MSPQEIRVPLAGLRLREAVDGTVHVFLGIPYLSATVADISAIFPHPIEGKGRAGRFVHFP
jgi:hypothetical protein